MKCIIRVERDKHMAGTAQARRDWASVYQKNKYLKAPAFFDIERKLRYTDILGGIGYPSEKQPGIVMVFGIIYQEEEERVILKIIDCFESRSVYDIINHAVKIREKYGYKLDHRILPNWIGDQEAYLPIVARVSAELEREIGHNAGLYIAYPHSIDEGNPFPLFIREIKAAIVNNELDYDGFPNIIRYLQELPKEAADEGRIKDYPILGLLGAVVHSLKEQRPWEIQTEDDGLAFNIAD